MTNEEKLYERTIQLLHERGVQLSDIGELVTVSYTHLTLPTNREV